jgi:hypothetical protein
VNSRAGTFDFANVTPGLYRIIATSVDKHGSMTIDVRDSDIDNVELVPRSGILVSTHVRIEGRPAATEDPAYAFLRFRYKSEPGIPGDPGSIYSTFSDGSVNLDLTPGEGGWISLVAVADTPAEFQDAYIQSIRMGARDVLNNGLEFNAESDAKMEIVIGVQAGRISGTVKDDSQSPSINTTVVLVPDSVRRGRPDAFKTAMTDESGNFQIGQIPPGDYIAFAWDDVETDQWLDPEFIRQYQSRGTPVHIDKSSRSELKLPLLRPM